MPVTPAAFLSPKINNRRREDQAILSLHCTNSSKYADFTDIYDILNQRLLMESVIEWLTLALAAALRARCVDPPENSPGHSSDPMGTMCLNDC
jgi:hypothetical protein